MAPDRRSGFMLLEVLVAAAVAVVLITLLARIAGDNRHRVEAIRGASGAMAVARTVLEEVSARDAIAAGERRGQAGAYRWAVVTERLGEVTPVADRSNADQEGNTGGGEAQKWTLYRIGVAVIAPDGRATRLETHRLGRQQGS